jgi:hypothetical protein
MNEAIQALQAYKTHLKEQGRAREVMVVDYCITLVKRVGNRPI